ncbi:MAG: hypothetical protein QFC78_07535 [Pseudomonadota bacterium]|nr:hypothetical protein [Pseudomonadota bacterium]
MPDDPHRWLTDQLSKFDPCPAAIATALPSGRLIEMLRDSRDEKRDLKAEAKQTGSDPKTMKQQGKAAGMPGPPEH